MIDLNVDQHRPLAFFGIRIDKGRESIEEWVRWCKRQGFRGFNIIIATDCEGRANEEWINKLLDAYEVAFKTAEEEGLEVWIFDDWGYPSGTAGGLVCTEPSFRLKRLVISHDCIIEPGSSISIKVPEKFVAAGIMPQSRGEYKPLDLKPGQIFEYSTGEHAERLVVVAWEYDKHAAKSSCKSYPGDPAMSCIDMLNPEATRRFLEVMHERYYNRFSKYFGNVIKGFFYDEPYLSFEFPWTEKLPQTFMEKKGYDLLKVLPQIMVNAYYARSGPMAKYTDDYFDVWTDMAADNYYGEMKKWCQKHGVELSGHQDLDHHLNTLLTISGHFFKDMSHNDRPAVDVIWAQIDPGTFTDFPRYAGSVKRLLGRKHATSETFAGMGEALHGDIMRYITDHQVIRGIDDFHLMYSNNSPFKGHSGSPQMPNHMLQEPFGRLIYSRMAKSSALASIGNSAAYTALYLPAFDLHRAQLGLRQVGITNAERLPWEWINDIAMQLTYLPCDFDYIWDEALLSLDVVDGGIKTLSGHIINTIILPPNCTFTDKVLEKLREFHQKGGQIISVFRANWALEKEAVICSELDSLGDFIKTSIRLSPQRNISLCTRLDGERTIYMLLNESTKDTEVDISISGSGTLYEVSLVDDSIDVVCSSSPICFNTKFEGCQMKVFILDKSVSSNPNATSAIKSTDHSEAPSCCRSAATAFAPEHCIVPVNWSLEMPDGSVTRLEGTDFPDWAALGWPLYSGLMKYKAVFDLPYDVDSAIIKAKGLHYHAIISIDGKECGRMAFRPYELKLRNLAKGSHTIEICVYNTTANEVLGTLEVQKERYSKRFWHVADYDRKRLKSGLTKPVEIIIK